MTDGHTPPREPAPASLLAASRGSTSASDGMPAVAGSLHHLKTWPEYYRATVSAAKCFEFRRDDRGFAVGDTLSLDEWDPETQRYTGERYSVVVTYILRGALGLPEGYCIMSIHSGGL